MQITGTLGFVFLLLFKIFTGEALRVADMEFEMATIAPNPGQQPPRETENFASLRALSRDIQNLWNLRKNSVVKIMGIKKGDHSRENLLFGTGFFADGEGNILTAATIAIEAENLWIEYGGLSYAATIVGKDSTTNLAVIKLLKKPESFTPISLGEMSPRRTQPEGSLVISIGCALGMEPAPTMGLITGKNIVFGDRVFATTYLRSDIAICGGESGAPVFYGDGSLCGILIASLPELRSSFIIPERALGHIFNGIVNDNTLKYCTAGFSARGQMSETGKKEIAISSIDGAKISYGEKEILKIGDIVKKIDGQEITNESDIADILFFKRPNDSLNMDILRGWEALQISIILGEKNF
jgi:serine protease Do